MPDGPTLKVNIREVARQAGVSVATVSRVFNGNGPVRDVTRARIIEIAERLRYSPHGAARSLTMERTETVGVLLPDMHGEFFSELIRGLDLAARARGYHLLVSSSHASREEAAAVLRTIRGRVDGLILMSPEGVGADGDGSAVADGIPPLLPTVLLNSGATAGFDSLGIDNLQGVGAMIEHLAGLGHRRIALIAGPAQNFDAAERRRGYRDALARLGLPHDPADELAGDFSEAAGFAAGRAFASRRERPDAVFAANDAMAVGCLFALREAGIDVPGEIAVAGFDDIPVGRYTSPPLSSVHVPIERLGARALEWLLRRIQHGNDLPTRTERLATTLVVRSSCGAGRSLRNQGDRRR